MRIAHILPHSITLPLTTHNGRYDWVLQLAQLQVEHGHDVTIYCNPSSSLANIRTRGIGSQTADRVTNNLETFRLAFANEHDIYHSHFDNLHYRVANETLRPIVFTQHWWPTEETISLAQRTGARNVWAIPPTRHMLTIDALHGIKAKRHIYHGIDLNQFQPAATVKSGRLLFVSRIAPEKNLDLAIDVALAAGVGLDIIGKVTQKNQNYWERISARIDNKNIRYLGPKTQEELITYYSSALALLFPSDTNEPFGLVAIEAQACGTPVIMKRGGSRGELIEEGTTGFLCESQTDFTAAVLAVASVKPSECIHFARNFDVRTMNQQYQLLYEELVRQEAS